MKTMNHAFGDYLGHFRLFWPRKSLRLIALTSRDREFLRTVDTIDRRCWLRHAITERPNRTTRCCLSFFDDK